MKASNGIEVTPDVVGVAKLTLLGTIEIVPGQKEQLLPIRARAAPNLGDWRS
jgi:hypothetical protein